MELYELVLAISCSAPAYYYVWKSYQPSKLDIAWYQNQCDRGHHIWGKIDWHFFGNGRVQHRKCKHCSIEEVLIADGWSIFTQMER